MEHLVEADRQHKIKEFVNSFSTDKNFLKSVYNKHSEGFNPEKDYVYYSGPYWTEDEFVAAVETTTDSIQSEKSLSVPYLSSSGNSTVTPVTAEPKKLQKAFLGQGHCPMEFRLSSSTDIKVIMLEW